MDDRPDSGALVNRRQFGRAYWASWEAVLDDKRNSESWLALSLAANLAGRTRIALLALERSRGLGCDDLRYGDGLRDHALTAIRQRRFTSARRLITTARKLHAQDENRMACLDMAEGRLLHALGDPKGAVGLYCQAHETWEELGAQANAQWHYNLYIHWLLSAACLRDPSDKQWLLERIETQCPTAAKPRTGEAKTITTRIIGPSLYITARSARVRAQQLATLLSG